MPIHACKKSSSESSTARNEIILTKRNLPDTNSPAGENQESCEVTSKLAQKMYYSDNSEKMKTDKSSQAAVSTGEELLSVVSSDPKNNVTPVKSYAKSNKRKCLSFWKYAVIFGGCLFGIGYIILKIMLPVVFFYSASGIIVRQDHSLGNILPPEATKVIDEDPFFNYRKKFGNWITQAENYDAFTNTGEHSKMRFKRTISRDKIDCSMKAKNCEKLLETLYIHINNYNNFKDFLSETSEELLKCLHCNNRTSQVTKKFEEDSKTQPNIPYFSSDYSEQNHAQDPLESGLTVIKLLNNTKAKNSSQYFSVDGDGGVNLTETTKNQMVEKNPVAYDISQDVAKGSSKSTYESTKATSTDGTSLHESIQKLYHGINSNLSLDNNSSSGNSVTNGSHFTKFLSNETNVSDTPSSVNKTALIDESKVAKSSAVTLKLVTMKPSSVTMPYYTISKYGTKSDRINKITKTDSIGFGETSTQKPSIDFTEQIAESMTSSQLTKYVTGSNDDNGLTYPSVHPSVYPSFEGHREKQPTATVSGARSKGNFGPFGSNVMSADHFTKDDKFVDNPGTTTKSVKGTQQLLMTPAMSWTTPHAVCFYGYPGQLFNKQFSSGSTFYPDFSNPAFPQNQLSGFQGQLHRGTSFSASPNYVQAQSMQLMPKLNYAGSLTPTQPTGSSVGPTEPTSPNIPIFLLNQQQSSTTEASFSGPYFCTYISIATFPSISSTSQLSHSFKKPKNSLEELSESYDKNRMSERLYNSAYPSACPPNSYQCRSDGYCISKEKLCDGRVDCADASDEISCSCKNRLSEERLCDGYFDCPHGEDELGCSDCPEDSFNCDVWDHWHSRDNCVPLAQRCDGVVQCPNGKDEMNCNILAASRVAEKDIFPVGYVQGYLHKNIQGRWYPVCSSEPPWTVDACTFETGQPVTVTPEIDMVQLADNFFGGPYVNVSNGQIQLVPSCSNSAIFVKCPPLICGTRVSPRSSLVSNEVGNNYVGKRHAEVSSASDFSNYYQEMLKLLNVEVEKQDDNDTFVGSQVRVVGGRASQPADWPFVVAIYQDGHFHCGGVIIDEIWILTAAHCMYGYHKHYFEVYAGILRRFSFSPMTQSRRAKKVMIHPNFEIRAMQNDVAMIMLNEPFFFNRWIRPVCLPAANTAGSEWEQGPSVNSICVAIGWGATRELGLDPDHLQEVEVPILSSCKHTFEHRESTICAGYPQGGYDACQGDSGGPLMCRNPSIESQWYVAGVISHGEGCGIPNEPGVYTKVSYFVQWIQELIQNPSLLFNEVEPLATCPGFSCRGELSVKCLPTGKQCNRIVDCLDAEDEINCSWQTFGGYGQYKQSTSDSESVELVQLENSTSKAPKEGNIKTSSNKAQIQTNDDDFNDIEFNEINDNADAMTFKPNVKVTFACTNLLQTIMIDKRCDRHFDCEDGTDEDCTCKDYLLNLQPTAVCDGYLDCNDGTDEEHCDICKGNEFHCSRSGKCISINARCDQRIDCPLGEDEADCFALTNGEYLNVDSENRPALNREGLLSNYIDGTWQTKCLQSAIHDNGTIISKIAENICAILGFANLESVRKIVVNRTELGTKSWKNKEADHEPTLNYAAMSEENVEACSALWIRCRPVLSGSADSYSVAEPRNGSYSYLWPWLAAIFVDGRYRCSALLLEPNWLLSSSKCTEDIKLSVNYTTALLGQSRSYLYVDGPHQQISVVDEIKNVTGSQVSLLHLRTAVNISRHVLPLFMEKKIYPPELNDLCVAIGTDEECVTRSIFLKPIIENCNKCQRCYEVQNLECPGNVNSSDWSGMVICKGQQGWYPAAIFHERNGFCSFRSAQNLTSIDYVHAYIMQALDTKLHPTPEPTCNGIRCSIGKCISWNQVCDGIDNCRDGADEMVDACEKRQRINNNKVSRKCARSELRCGNGECLPKNTFCDDKVDCSDGTDEPVNCTCAEYLRLTSPGRLCDGVRHCFDKTDELPEVCQCMESSFKCSRGNENSTCIPQDFVCDGYQDCPNGEDEKQCKRLEEFTKDKLGVGEITQRSYGVWHTHCFSAPPMSNETATAACKEMGYSSGIIDRSENRTLGKPIVPYRDNFHVIRLNVDTWIIMRDNKPLVSLIRPENPCYRLFVRCTA